MNRWSIISKLFLKKTSILWGRHLTQVAKENGAVAVHEVNTLRGRVSTKGRSCFRCFCRCTWNGKQTNYNHASTSIWATTRIISLWGKRTKKQPSNPTPTPTPKHTHSWKKYILRPLMDIPAKIPKGDFGSKDWNTRFFQRWLAYDKQQNRSILLPPLTTVR